MIRFLSVADDFSDENDLIMRLAAFFHQEIQFPAADQTKLKII